MSSPYDFHERAFCACGWSDKPSFGDLWFTRQKYPVCPNCGESSYGLTLETVRWKSLGWFKGGDWHRPDGTRRQQESAEGANGHPSNQGGA